MKLSLLSENVNYDRILNAIKSLNIKVLARSSNVILIEPHRNQYDQLRFAVRRYGWQIHSIAPFRNDKLLIHITPLRGTKYNHRQDKLYHITDVSRVDNILANGLNLKSEALEMKFPKRIYLYPTAEMARSRFRYAKAVNFGGKKIDPVLLEIDNHDHSIKLVIDPEAFMDFMTSHYEDDVDIPVYTTRTIPPDRIKVVDYDGRPEAH